MGDGVVVVGTAHVSPQSVADVERTIRERRPTRVLVELDARRLEALRDPQRWRDTDLLQIIREKRQHMFLLQLYLANMQARIGEETGVAPGAELLRAVEVADEVGAEVVLIDRDIAITLRRGFGAMGFWQRFRLFWNVWVRVLTPTERERPGTPGHEPRPKGKHTAMELDVDALLENDAITAMTEEFARVAPVVKTALIDERDAYMASHIAQRSADASVVAVIGAGHVAGVRRLLAAGTSPSPEGRAALDETPKRRVTVARILAYVLPAVVLGGFALIAIRGDFGQLRDAWIYWVLVNGGLSALGALLARGHPLSVLTAFVAAPLTSLSPMLAAGWFAGLVEAKIHTPTVADFEGLQKLATFRDFWRNDVVRILLVTALANLGSSIGTWLGLVEIIQAAGGGG